MSYVWPGKRLVEVSAALQTDSASLIAAARAMAGLHEFDNDSYREGLDLVARNLATNRKLSDAGRQMLAGIAVACLANRLKVADYLRRHEHLLERAVERPIFILGAPRTGTTLVSHLMATDPRWRCLLRWEALNCVPPPTDATLKSDPRCLQMKQADASSPLRSAAHIHHEEADTPTECVIVHAQDFKSLLFDVATDDPVYANWILYCDLTPTYRFHRRELQTLQAHTTGRWVLKAPSHALFVHDLLKVYPDARLIWTHRDPYRALASLCSLVAHFRGQFSEVVPRELGPQYVEHFKLHLDRPTEVDGKEPGGRVFHLHYAKLVANPLTEMRRLYEWLEEPLSEPAERAMRAWLARNPQGKFGSHSYDLQTYGLTRESLQPQLQPYVQRYGVELEHWKPC